ncbi:MAG TPA: HPF/RaiA family ribosome-associated protein [Candidatus Acidoferrales bacterium]|jgi:ribosome-associated translation inhibitor RaiA
MKITYSHIELEFRIPIEHETERHADKLNRLLKHYAADLVHLHGSLEKIPHKPEFSYAVNLTLPTGTLHATATGTLPLGAAKGAFAELETQIKKHQQKLRKDYVWKRKRALRTVLEPNDALSSD